MGSLGNTTGDHRKAAAAFSDDRLQAFVSGFGHNDLQPPAEAACHEVTQALHWLNSQFGNSRMTGSGSAVFSRVGPDASIPATWPSDGAPALPDGWVGRLCRSLSSHPLVDWAD